MSLNNYFKYSFHINISHNINNSIENKTDLKLNYLKTNNDDRHGVSKITKYISQRNSAAHTFLGPYLLNVFIIVFKFSLIVFTTILLHNHFF